MKLSRAALAVSDLMALLAASAAVIVAVSGGGEFDVAAHHVRAHSVRALVVSLSAWAIVRYLLRSRAPLFGVQALGLERIGERAVAALRRVATDALGSSAERRFGLANLISIVVLGTAAVKATNAVVHYGFFSGDDVEIHEMTLGHAFGLQWPTWSLRSAFYPMTLIYPVQRLLIGMGVVDTGNLVIAGRMVVVALSSAGLWLLYRMLERSTARGVAALAVLLLATAALQVEFGGTELPRVVSAIFVAAAYVCIVSRGTDVAVATAGALLAIAACMRFSEVSFIVPAVAQLALQRRWRSTVVLVMTFAVIACAIQAWSDYSYWGNAFGSVVTMIDFTLIQRLSSRGYESTWYYFVNVTAWTDLLVIGLAVIATRRTRWALGLWVWLPILELSFLPHKEPRYLLPSLPLLSLLAAYGFFDVVERMSTWRPKIAECVAVGLLVAIPLRLVDQASSYHVRRTDAEVSLAKRMNGTLPRAPIAIESAWRFGGRLYLGRDRTVEDLDSQTLSVEGVEHRLRNAGVRAVVVSSETCTRTSCGESLGSSGFIESLQLDAQNTAYKIFVRP
jgi:hypothetical protein